MKNKSKSKTSRKTNPPNAGKSKSEMTEISLNPEDNFPDLMKEIPLTDPLQSSTLKPQVVHNPLNKDENFIGMGTTPMEVWEAPIPISWLDDPRIPKPPKTCCEKHPEKPVVDISSLKMSPDWKKIWVGISASHPCGIVRVVLVVMDIDYEVDPQGKVTKKYVFHKVNGKYLMSDTTMPQPFQKQAIAAIPFPTESLWGKPHAMRFVAMANCKLPDGEHQRFNAVVKDFMII